LWVENGAWLKSVEKTKKSQPKWPRFRKASLNAKAGRVQIRIAQDILDLDYHSRLVVNRCPAP